MELDGTWAKLKLSEVLFLMVPIKGSLWKWCKSVHVCCGLVSLPSVS